MAHHGCVCVWKIDVYLKVLKYHDTYFQGEDLQESIIPFLHPKEFPNFKMGFDSRVVVPTRPPSTLWDYYKQRAHGWYTAEYKFVPRLTRLLLKCDRRTMFWKPIIILHLYTVIKDVLGPLLLLCFSWLAMQECVFPEMTNIIGNVDLTCDMVLFKLSNFGWMQVASFILSWFVVGFFNTFMLESDEKVSMLCMILFPLFQMFDSMILRPIALFRQIFILFPKNPPGEKIGDRADNGTLPTVENTVFGSADGIGPHDDEEEDADALEDNRDIAIDIEVVAENEGEATSMSVILLYVTQSVMEYVGAMVALFIWIT